MSSTSFNALDSMAAKETMVPDSERRRALLCPCLESWGPSQGE